MKQVAIFMLAALLLNGCGNNATPTQQAAGGIWGAQLLGGEGSASGYSFTTQFTLSGNNLSISYFQFLNQSTANPPCFPVNGGTIAGTMILTENQTNYTVTGPFSFSVQSGGNTLMLSGNVTGTENGLNGTVLSGGLVTGTWTLAGATGCNDTTGGSFTMTQT
jgi:hypothetical protein